MKSIYNFLFLIGVFVSFSSISFSSALPLLAEQASGKTKATTTKADSNKSITTKGDTAKSETAKSDTAKGDSLGGSLKGLSGKDDKNTPLYIKSDNLNLDAQGRTFTYEGKVEIIRGDVTINADKAIGKYSQDNKIETMTCVGNVVILRSDGLRASANKAFYNVNKATIELTESPELIQGENALSADKFTVFVNNDRFLAEGSVRAKVIKGNTMMNPKK